MEKERKQNESKNTAENTAEVMTLTDGENSPQEEKSQKKVQNGSENNNDFSEPGPSLIRHEEIVSNDVSAAEKVHEIPQQSIPQTRPSKRKPKAVAIATPEAGDV